MKLKNIFIALIMAFMGLNSAYAEEASLKFSIDIPEYLQIQTITSPVLMANITDKTGNLYSPLSSRFKVISNSEDTKTLFLKSQVLTDNGLEESMFQAGGVVYIAFANVSSKPKSQSLANCKLGTHPKESPGIVAYPITSILGTESKFQSGKGKYEIYIKNGTTYITVNVGSHVLQNSFASNDPKGFYQATLSLTEADI